ncbi:hypothetical protein HDU85_001901 [Gaertneriomyces sp. JEL0708]|nr:hypothetical protein HDU85_001901 [Gaertneriomyces sp. JEL0708]
MAGIEVFIDRGGTFTDTIAFCNGKTHVVKLLSVDPHNYADAPTESIRRVLEHFTGKEIDRNRPVPTEDLSVIRMATTVATNALLERKGERCALLISKGFKDLLYIGNQARPDLFTLEIKCPDVLYDEVVEVDERVILVNSDNSTRPAVDDSPLSETDVLKKGITGEWVYIRRKPDLDALRAQLERIRDQGIHSIAVCLMHSYTYPDHEIMLEGLCKSLGFSNVSLSTRVMPMVKIVSRGNSAAADAYLTPCLLKYLQNFQAGFDQGIQKNVRVEFMQSDGGLTNELSGVKAVLSGPAGGLVGYAQTSWEKGGKAIIGFDMGGTSTDVSRFAGRYEHVFESSIEGVTLYAPQLDIRTVAAGGSSRLFFQNGLFVVGKNGHLAVTDANLFLNRLLPNHFPHIFGPKANEPLDTEATSNAFVELTQHINSTAEKGKHMTPDEVAYGFIKVANETMSRPIRALTLGKGLDAREHILACFGGAAGQHACGVARALGIRRVLIHKYSSILSAYGLSLAAVVHEEQEPSALTLQSSAMEHLAQRVADLKAKCQDALKQQGFTPSRIINEVYLNLRYQGTSTALMTPQHDDDWECQSFLDSFVRSYQQEFGFTLQDRDIIVDDIRVRSIGSSSEQADVETSVHEELRRLQPGRFDSRKCSSVESVYWEGGRKDTPAYLLQDLEKGDEVLGPAIIVDKNTTIVVEPGYRALVTSEHVVLDAMEDTHVRTVSQNAATKACDPILLSIFSHRFMSIGEQMGKTLQKTAISTNIKERLDFSCALFSADGSLLSNSPSIPIHLGSMADTIRYQIAHHGADLKEGDVIMTNHPSAGGTHLPDITLLSGVWVEGKLCCFVANRGHHTDVGGMTAGSMPPGSQFLYQEGAAIKSFKIVRNGQFDEAGLIQRLVDEPGQYPGCSGTRSLRDNISDLKAQVAANVRGIHLVKMLVDEYGLDVVVTYMQHIRDNAALSVKRLLKNIHAKSAGAKLESVDYMDDGSPIKLAVHIEVGDTEDDTRAVFDFTGTGVQCLSNINAPKSITSSAIIYSLRCLLASDIPLNQGVLDPIKIIIPKNSLLDPSDLAAVVGGNVMTSQRLVDVIFKAFEACAASQGAMNNFTFGRDATEAGPDKSFGYYETIGGGSGAGPTWHGRSAVQVHMTNTRSTDPEILERRYPVVLREFSVRDGSGGKGQYSGGNGIVRELEFLEPLQVSMLSERRVHQPYGLRGGNSGAAGRNLIILASGQTLNFGGKNSLKLNKGDRMRIETPGGGGWGSSDVKR